MALFTFVALVTRLIWWCYFPGSKVKESDSLSAIAAFGYEESHSDKNKTYDEERNKQADYQNLAGARPTVF